MAKQFFSVGDKFFFYENTTGEIFECHFDKVNSPTKEIIKALCEQLVDDKEEHKEQGR